MNLTSGIFIKQLHPLVYDLILSFWYMLRINTVYTLLIMWCKSAHVVLIHVYHANNASRIQIIIWGHRFSVLIAEYTQITPSGYNCVCMCMCICYLTLSLTGFSYSITIICLNPFFLSFFPEQFCSFTCYTDGMFQSKFSFKDNKVLFYLNLDSVLNSHFSNSKSKAFFFLFFFLCTWAICNSFCRTAQHL